MVCIPSVGPTESAESSVNGVVLSGDALRCAGAGLSVLVGDSSEDSAGKEYDENSDDEPKRQLVEDHSF